MIEPKPLHEILFTRRLKLKITMKALSKASELTEKEIYDLEVGKHQNLSDAAIKRYSLHLRIHPDSLMGMLGRMPEDLLTIFKKRPSLVADLLRNLDLCDDHQVKHVNEILKRKKVTQPRINKEEFEQYWKLMERITPIPE